MAFIRNYGLYIKSTGRTLEEEDDRILYEVVSDGWLIDQQDLDVFTAHMKSLIKQKHPAIVAIFEPSSHPTKIIME